MNLYRDWFLASIGTFLLILSIIGIKGCVEADQLAYRKKENAGHWMPDGATNIVRVGKKWQEFTYKDQRFLQTTHLKRNVKIYSLITDLKYYLEAFLSQKLQINPHPHILLL